MLVFRSMYVPVEDIWYMIKLQTLKGCKSCFFHRSADGGERLFGIAVSQATNLNHYSINSDHRWYHHAYDGYDELWWAVTYEKLGRSKSRIPEKKISKVVKSLSFVSSSCLQKLSCLFSPVAFSWFFIGCLPLTKSKMTIEHPRFEDVFPIKHGDFPASHFSFRGVTTQPKQAKHGSLDYGVQSESTTIHPLREAKLFLSTIEFLPFPIEIYIYILYNVIYIYIWYYLWS